MRFHDGSLHRVALIEGDDSYTALMRRLATGPINRIPDHFDSNWEKLQYLKARAQRLANKLLGRPATPETAILASMVSQLLEATKKTRLGDGNDNHNPQTIDAAILSSPDRIRLNDEELGDIFDHLKLRNLMTDNNDDGKQPTARSLYQLYATSAAYAGYGKGLCRTYTDAYECEREEHALPLTRVLHLDLNAASLSGTAKTLRSADAEGGTWADAQFVDAELGSSSSSSAAARKATALLEEADGYWSAVSERVREFARALPERAYAPRVTGLLLTGPSASDRRFRSVVREALDGLVAEDDGTLELLARGNGTGTGGARGEWDSLFGFATALGAAEIAKRRLEGPVGCAQSDECRRRREGVHGGGRGSVFVDQHADI